MSSKEGVLRQLQMNRALGSANTCPNCDKSGHFGAISRYEDGDKVYLICGWCFVISEVKNE